MSFILAKTEQLLATMVVSSSITASTTAPDFNVYTGMDDEEKAAPALIINADSATEHFPNSGVWEVKTELKVKEIAADSHVTSSFASELMEVFLNDNVKTVLNTYPGYYCHALIVEDSTNTRDGDAWVQTVRMNVVCSLT